MMIVMTVVVLMIYVVDDDSHVIADYYHLSGSDLLFTMDTPTTARRTAAYRAELDHIWANLNQDIRKPANKVRTHASIAVHSHVEPFVFQHQTANSPFLLSHITYGRDGENPLIYQRNSCWVIMFS